MNEQKLRKDWKRKEILTSSALNRIEYLSRLNNFSKLSTVTLSSSCCKKPLLTKNLSYPAWPKNIWQNYALTITPNNAWISTCHYTKGWRSSTKYSRKGRVYVRLEIIKHRLFFLHFSVWITSRWFIQCLQDNLTITHSEIIQCN